MTDAARTIQRVAAGVRVLALPFILLARRERAASDPITGAEPTPPLHA